MRAAGRQRDLFYNSVTLSRLLVRAEASGNEKMLAVATTTSLWHGSTFGRYAFCDGGHAIDLDAVMRGLDLN